MSQNVSFKHVGSIIGITVPIPQELFRHSCAERVIHNTSVDLTTTFQDRLNRLWQERERAIGAKLPNREVSKACGMSERTISSLRTIDGRLPSASNLKALADYFCVNSDWLSTGVGEPNSVTSLSPEESELLLLYRSLTESGKGYILGRAQEIFADEHKERTRPKRRDGDSALDKLYQ